MNGESLHIEIGSCVCWGWGWVWWPANWKSLQLQYHVDIVIDVNRNISGVSTCIFRLCLTNFF